MKKVPFISVIPLLTFASSAHAADNRVTAIVTVSSAYIVPEQAKTLSTLPAINVGVDLKHSKNCTANLWAQFSTEENGREIDVGETCTKQITTKLSAHASVALYLYPDGGTPTYTATVGATYTIDQKTTIMFDVQGFAGAQKTANFRLAALRVVPIGHTAVTVMLGKAWNTGENQGLNPWYGAISLPVGRKFTLGASGYVAHGTRHIVANLSFKF